MSIKRAEATEKAIRDFTEGLFSYQDSEHPENIQMAFIQFSALDNTKTMSEVHNDNPSWEWTSDKDQILGNETDGYRLSITNWEAALMKALDVLESADNDPTFVIFVTDGRPVHRVGYDDDGNPIELGGDNADILPNYLAARNEAYDVAHFQTGDDDDEEKGDVTFLGLYAFGRSSSGGGNAEGDYLDDLVYYSTHGEDREGFDDETLETDNYYKSVNAQELEAAVSSIFEQVISILGVNKIAIEDGTTHQVPLEAEGAVGNAHLLTVDAPDTFKYWLEVPVDANGQYSKIDLFTQETITYTFSKIDEETIEISWTKNGTAGSVQLPGKQIVDETDPDNPKVSYKFEWKQNFAGDDPFYEKEPPTATYTESTGVVNWDLTSLGFLLDKVTYSVTFDVWPSQETYDIITDLENGDITYSQLDPAIQKYLLADGTLKTNTYATLQFGDTRIDNQTHHDPYGQVEPVPTDYSEMSVIKY